jgi:23S rRNA pseudouridine1911/1915/1917 synthase
MNVRWNWIVDGASAGVRADKAIHDALEGDDGVWEGDARPASRNQVQKLIEEGRVRRNGVVLERPAKLAADDAIDIDFPEPEPLELVPENIPLEILFEDDHLLVVNKQPALTVHPSPTQKTGTLVHALLYHCRAFGHGPDGAKVPGLSGIGGWLRPGIVHRIDKDTSGALVVTKTDEAHLRLSAVFAKHEIERAYSALCYGGPSWNAPFRLETRIGRNPNDRLKMTTEVKVGRTAVTRFSCQERYGFPDKAPFASLIEARLETGRTHQVRVHLTSLNHSLLGDPLYGVPSANQPKWKALPSEIQELVQKLPGQALHARVLGFRHPITGENLRFEASYPPDYQRLLDTLRKYA